MSISVVIAPDSFKGSLPARAVAQAIAQGWRDVRPDDRITILPQADGGEGTLDAIQAALPGAKRHDIGTVTGPDGRPTPGAWLELPGQIGVVELAQCCGLPLMARPDPLHSATVGLGEVIGNALAAGMVSLVIGLGGSASTDGAAGALSALGLRLTDDTGRPVPVGGAGLAQARHVDRGRFQPQPAEGVTLLTDVSAPLLGPTGAARVFGPQKGAGPDDIAQLDAALANYAALLGGNPDLPGMGAAGGCGYGFTAAWGARVEPGAGYVARLSGLPEAIAQADVVLSGEGRLDPTSATGKVVGELCKLAQRSGTPVGVIAGSVDEPPAGLWTSALIDLAGSLEEAIAHPEPLLRQAGAAAARHFAD